MEFYTSEPSRLVTVQAEPDHTLHGSGMSLALLSEVGEENKPNHHVFLSVSMDFLAARWTRLRCKTAINCTFASRIREDILR